VRRTILANGHRFDSDLVCRAAGCSRSWSEQQVSPTKCRGELAIPYPKPVKRQMGDPFSILGQEHGVHQNEIQTTSEYGAHAASLVMGGKAGRSWCICHRHRSRTDRRAGGRTRCQGGGMPGFTDSCQRTSTFTTSGDIRSCDPPVSMRGGAIGRQPAPPREDPVTEREVSPASRQAAPGAPAGIAPAGRRSPACGAPPGWTRSRFLSGRGCRRGSGGRSRWGRGSRSFP